MCRYAFKTYKPHFVCFACQKQFKRPPIQDVLARTGKLETLRRFERVFFRPTELARAERRAGTTLDALTRDYRALVSKCPQCGNAMADLGLDFKPPRTSAARSWSRIRGMYRIGHVWHTCGCYGPGFVPTDATDYQAYLAQRYNLFAARLKSAQRRATLDPAARIAEGRHWTDLLERVKLERDRSQTRA